jgi:pre-mRNA-processing factor 40
MVTQPTSQELLQELVDTGAIRARTKWKQIFPELKEDPRYTGMLGNPGSNPLELFWDVVDSLDQRLDSRIVGVTRAIAAYNKSNVEKASRAKAASSKPESAEGTEGEGGAAAMDTAADVANVADVADAEDGEEPKGFVIMPGTTFEEMQAVVKGQEEVKDLTEKDLQLVYYAVGHCFFPSPDMEWVTDT